MQTTNNALLDTVIDLCCGTCSWSLPWLARGRRVVAVDVVKHRLVPAEVEFHQIDVRLFNGVPYRGRCAAVLASPPCDEYARFKMPWTRARNPPEPDLSIWQACERIAAEADAPLLLENVESAQRWHGSARWHFGPFYLWGDGLPALMPKFSARHFRKKESYGSKERDRRAMIPPELAEHIAQCYATTIPTFQQEVTR